MSTIPNRRKNSRNEVSAELAAATRAVEEDCHQRMAKIRQNARMKDILQLKEVTLNEQMRPLMMQNRALYQL
jgi:hypothetical protein